MYKAPTLLLSLLAAFGPSNLRPEPFQPELTGPSPDHTTYLHRMPDYFRRAIYMTDRHFGWVVTRVASIFSSLGRGSRNLSTGPCHSALVTLLSHTRSILPVIWIPPRQLPVNQANNLVSMDQDIKRTQIRMSEDWRRP
jgi:hypothetical protein